MNILFQKYLRIKWTSNLDSRKSLIKADIWIMVSHFGRKDSHFIIKWVISSQPQPYLQSTPKIAAINYLVWMFWREIQISSKGKNFQRKHNTDQSYLVALSIYLFSIDLLIYGFREALDKNGPQIWNRGKV